MTYQVLYRVWRPQDFQELVGQEHIRRTLENAIELDRISHAYLFTGPRGTGKTSAARILAKALNCARRQGAHPCGDCESCRSIAQGHSLDVLEIDGASNRGIEEIRELKDKIGYLPALGKYKVYIVDEVHMLTNEAFNALLKTLEEPPAHVIFVLATTDPQKLPPTVLSRCQRFDFRKLSYEAIQKRLTEIIASQPTAVEPEALALIIRQADGGLRDAINLLDQCLSFSPERLTLDGACQILGLVRQDILGALLAAIVGEQPQQLFQTLADLFAQGAEPNQLLREFAGYCRDLLLLAICGEYTDLVAAAGEQRQLMIAQSRRLGSARLQALVSRLDQGAVGGRGRGSSRFMAEALFAGLLLEQAGPGAGAGTGAGAGVGTGAGAGVGAGSGAPAGAGTALGASAMPATAPSPPTAAAPTPLPTAGRKAPAAGKKGGAAAAALPASQAPTAPPFASEPPRATEPAPAAPPFATAPAPVPPTDWWSEILRQVKEQKVTLHAFLKAVEEQSLAADTLLLLFDPEKGRFHKERCQEKENLELLTKITGQALGRPVTITCDFKKKEDPLDPVEKAKAIFGDDIVKVIDA
ncbi:MAG: DNA polymerase III subunit gamma/tau [Peptococcaceae bacterium]|jgi:DNA polymerase-3 subunit gamma/tau|nr:DNA polymerase III subunit gamma/tau [Peptococcaceae bacterium]